MRILDNEGKNFEFIFLYFVAVIRGFVNVLIFDQAICCIVSLEKSF